jgi:alkylation response protein AidB-like acyl-CoA dehydrogenase
VLLELTSEQRMLRDVSRQLVGARCPISRVRELDDQTGGTVDRALWRECASLGWSALLIDEQYGGGSASDNGLVDLAVIAEELGRSLHPSPFQAVNIAAVALSSFGSAAQRERFLPGIASGDLILTWAFAEPRAAWSARSVALEALATPDGFVLNGRKTCVQDAASADWLIVSAMTPDGLTQFLVAKDHPGVTIEALIALDLSNRLYQVDLTDVVLGHESLIGASGNGGPCIDRMLQVALVLQCADSNGATDAALDLTVQYAKDRVAFGRAIGSYQALKHRMAMHKVRLEGSFAIASYAAEAVGEQRSDASAAAHIAKAYVGTSNSPIVHDCIQLHGGIAMTWDYDLHLLVRRVLSNEMLYGPPKHHYSVLADLAEKSQR